MSWPPQIGELLPRGQDAYGVHEKLADYSLEAVRSAACDSWFRSCSSAFT